MPEAPELEVVKDFLNERAVGCEITDAAILKPSVVRSISADLVEDVVGRSLEKVSRRGKFLFLDLSGDRVIVINPMLTGGLQYAEPKDRVFKRTCLTFGLSNGRELRYVDDKQMGKIYYVSGGDMDKIPRLDEQGPDVLDDDTFDDFQVRLKSFPGEIKGVLTRGRVIAGIGNAYADEILFEAQVYPFKKRKALSNDELRRLFKSSRHVIEEATEVVRERMGDNIHVKLRDFLKVHNRGGEPCPRCGNNISQVTANKRITSYCRKCQPGMLLRN